MTSIFHDQMHITYWVYKVHVSVMMYSFLSLLHLSFHAWHGEELQVDDLRKSYKRIVVLPDLYSCWSLIWRSQHLRMWMGIREDIQFLGIEDYMLTVNLLGLQVTPEKVLVSCVLQVVVVKSLKQTLFTELLSVPLSPLFSCTLAMLSIPGIRKSQRLV